MSALRAVGVNTQVTYPGSGKVPFSKEVVKLIITYFGKCNVNMLVQGMYPVFDNALKMVAKATWKQLRTYEKRGVDVCTAFSLKILLASGHLIQEETTDAELSKLAQSYELTEVNLGWNETVTDVGLMALARHAQALTHFSLSSNEKITDKGVWALAAGANRSLLSIDVNQCLKLGDEMLLALGMSCPNLTSFGSVNSPSVTDGGVQALVRGTPRLTAFRLWGSYKVTGLGLVSLSKACLPLHSLSLFNLKDRAKDVDLMQLLMASPGLTDLKLFDCHLTDATLRVIASKCPKLERLSLGHPVEAPGFFTEAGVRTFISKAPSTLRRLDVRDLGMSHLSFNKEQQVT